VTLTLINVVHSWRYPFIVSSCLFGISWNSYQIARLSEVTSRCYLYVFTLLCWRSPCCV